MAAAPAAVELPPGFRFHPTDEELLTHYLLPKAADPSFAAQAICDADLNKCEPWDLPSEAKMEEAWYIFYLKDRKYPTGTRTNRATESGYWKATGKDKEICQGVSLLGMKKTLVFYTGRAPNGGKTDWVMHEYRLDGKYSAANRLAKPSKNEWVICRVFNKTDGLAKKKKMVAGVVARPAMEHGVCFSSLPPLMDISASTTAAAAMDVPCFSQAVAGQDELVAQFLNPALFYGEASGANPSSRQSLVQLLEGSQDTGLTSDRNPPEINSHSSQLIDEPLWGY